MFVFNVEDKVLSEVVSKTSEENLFQKLCLSRAVFKGQNSNIPTVRHIFIELCKISKLYI